MPAEVATLLGPLQSLLGWFQKNRIHRDAQLDAALDAMSKALFASMSYAEEQEGLGKPDRKRELELAALWSDAATKVRHASRELAVRLDDKSLYWSQPIKWSRQEVLQKRIDFQAVQHELRQLRMGS